MKSLKEEFLEMLSDYQGILHKVSLIYFKNNADREENIQEIIYQLWKSYPGLKNKNSIGSWIYAVSINTSIARLKKQSRIQYTDKIPEIPDRADFVRRIELDESLQSLLDAIHRLDEINRSVILLYLEEKSYDEIAEIIGISKSNVGVRINRIKEILRKNLKK